MAISFNEKLGSNTWLIFSKSFIVLDFCAVVELLVPKYSQMSFDSNCKDKDNSWNSKIKPRNFKGKVFFLPCFYSSLVYLHCPFAYLLMSKDSSMMNVLCSIWWVICILLMMWLWNYNQLMDLTEFISRILLIWNSTTMANVFEAFAAIVVLLRFCCCTTTRCKVVRL